MIARPAPIPAVTPCGGSALHGGLVRPSSCPDCGPNARTRTLYLKRMGFAADLDVRMLRIPAEVRR